MMHTFKPNQGSFPVFYQGYLDNIEDQPLIESLTNERDHALKILNTIPSEKANYQYAPGKWTIKQVLMHIIDTEFVFGYRAMAIARGEKQGLPGFDQDEYMNGVSVEKVSLNELITCFNHLRTANITMFSLLRPEDLEQLGTASGYQVSAGTIGYFISGHCRYHVDILKDRYEV